MPKNDYIESAKMETKNRRQLLDQGGRGGTTDRRTDGSMEIAPHL